MEEKKAIVKINGDTIDILSSNPDLKILVNKIIEQDDNFDFNSIEVECEDNNFDKESFKNIIIKSIEEFKKNLQTDEIKTKSDLEKIQKISKSIG